MPRAWWNVSGPPANAATTHTPRSVTIGTRLGKTWAKTPRGSRRAATWASRSSTQRMPTIASITARERPDRIRGRRQARGTQRRQRRERLRGPPQISCSEESSALPRQCEIARQDEEGRGTDLSKCPGPAAAHHCHERNGHEVPPGQRPSPRTRGGHASAGVQRTAPRIRDRPAP